MSMRGDVTINVLGIVEDEFHRPPWIVVPHRAKAQSHPDTNAEFFDQFSLQAGFWFFPRFDLSAGKLPLAGQRIADAGAPCNENEVTAADYAGRHAQSRRMG